MKEFLTQSVFFGMFLSLIAYFTGVKLREKLKHPLLNPLLIAIVYCIVVLLVFDIDFETYNSGAKYLAYLITPATVCLAIPLYEQFELLKKNYVAVLCGIIIGVLVSVTEILLFAIVFGFSHAEYVTFLPKSITTAIGMGLSEQMGGYVSITCALIILTGVFGNIFAEPILKLFGVTDPLAKGVGIGTAAHAVGTAKANEIGKVEGAMSGLAIAVAGLITVIAAMIYVNLY